MNNLNTSCAKSVIKSKKKYLVAGLDIQVAKFDLEKVGRILHVEEVVPAETHGNPGGDHRQQVLQDGPVERQGQAEMIDMNIFYGFILILIFQQFLWLLVTLDSGNMAERLRFLPQKHWGENKNYQNYQKIQNTNHKIQKTK